MGGLAPPGVAWFQGQSAPCSPPPLPSAFSLQKGQIPGATPPELPENGVRSPLTPPQGNVRQGSLDWTSHLLTPHTTEQNLDSGASGPGNEVIKQSAA
jgi:hypothetical protein